MICERCGNEIADNAIICPVCGTRRSPVPPPQPGQEDAKKPPEGYGGYYPQNNPGAYHGSYAPPPPHTNQQGYQSYVPPQQQQRYNYAPPYSVNPGYTPNINVTIINNGSSGGKNDGALVAEIIFSLLGIFGIGWLIAGETTIGIIILLCSIFLYWPIMFFGTIVTAGFGLVCLGPIMIASIIINVILLNNRLKRKATPFVIVQQPPTPPQQ